MRAVGSCGICAAGKIQWKLPCLQSFHKMITTQVLHKLNLATSCWQPAVLKYHWYHIDVKFVHVLSARVTNLHAPVMHARSLHSNDLAIAIATSFQCSNIWRHPRQNLARNTGIASFDRLEAKQVLCTVISFLLFCVTRRTQSDKSPYVIIRWSCSAPFLRIAGHSERPVRNFAHEIHSHKQQKPASSEGSVSMLCLLAIAIGAMVSFWGRWHYIPPSLTFACISTSDSL